MEREEIMYIYRIVLDAYDSRSSAMGARVVTYSRGHNRQAALRALGSVTIAQDGTVREGGVPWPGTNNMPPGPYVARSLPEWDMVSMRVVGKRGRAHIVWETESA